MPEWTWLAESVQQNLIEQLRAPWRIERVGADLLLHGACLVSLHEQQGIERLWVHLDAPADMPELHRLMPFLLDDPRAAEPDPWRYALIEDEVLAAIDEPGLLLEVSRCGEYFCGLIEAVIDDWCWRCALASASAR